MSYSGTSRQYAACILKLWKKPERKVRKHHVNGHYLNSSFLALFWNPKELYNGSLSFTQSGACFLICKSAHWFPVEISTELLCT